MKVVPVPCGPAVTESERLALERLKAGLISLPGDDCWYLLTNLMFSVTHQLQSEEIDIVAIGPPGVRVVEVKHWTDAHSHWAEAEADRVTTKARKIGTTLRKIVSGLPHVDGVVLLTRRASKVKRLAGGGKVRGVEFHPLKEWRAALRPDEPVALSPRQVKGLVRELEPKSAVAIDGALPLRRLAGYVNLELQTPKEEAFHRIYKGKHSSRKDRVFLHLYDMSANVAGSPERAARREHDALHYELSRFRWAPRVLDSFQDAPGYRGEMKFFTVLDPAVPNIEERAGDESWGLTERLDFARRTISAVQELHESTANGLGFVHRNLSAQTILVKHDNSPVLTGFEHVGTPAAQSISLAGYSVPEHDHTVAPEVRGHGLSAADQCSDIYSLCASLRVLFTDWDGAEGWQASEADKALTAGLGAPQTRPSLQELASKFAELLGQEVPQPAIPAPRFWTEDQEVRFQDRTYRVVARLGSGGVGTAFKVVELDGSTGRDVGTFVGKVVSHEATGEQVRQAYQRARQSVSRHPGLSAVFQVATEWQETEFVALATWIEGSTLADYAGVIPLLAEDQSDGPGEAEELVLRWLEEMCQALGALHANGLVHGDVSPGNIIVSKTQDLGHAEGSVDRLVLTDYDFVTRIGKPPSSPGTVLYGSPNRVRKGEARPSDDLFALAASFFHVLFETEPFVHDGHRTKEKGLNWEHGDREAYPRAADFMDRATDPDVSERFASVTDALQVLRAARSSEDPPQASPVDDDPSRADPPPSTPPRLPTVGPAERSPNEVPWLHTLLQSYPGSRWGNQETRGLDSEFAKRTYVKTELERVLHEEVLDRQVGLVVLCGNAGDGKTALLQHLTQELGLGSHRSDQRILQGEIEDGRRVHVNLDGSAAWDGRSADELLDEFLAPFRDGRPHEEVVHLLAINDGRLLEWIDHNGETALTEALERRLNDEFRLESAAPKRPGSDASSDPHIAFHSLNNRSHVGGIAWNAGTIDNDFLNQLVDRLYGGAEAVAMWESCNTCSAQEVCRVYQATRLFGPVGLSTDDESRTQARQRLFEALQAVHFRGETHITVRELRGALVYVLFGTDYCSDYHQGAAGTESPAYWDRAFDAEAPARQGDVLAEFVRLDPALEAHPKVDRRLLQDDDGSEGRESVRRLASARRRAYFEGIDGEEADVGLAQGRHIQRFRNAPFLDDAASARLCTDLCKGIARLGDLPSKAFRDDVVPLRIQPRTPTETAFWSEKPVSRFRLNLQFPRPTVSDDQSAASGVLAPLHRCVHLVYTYEDGRTESLRMGAELFHRLLELGEGYQLGDVSTDDAFANLSIFLQRLLREDDRELIAWSPIQEDATYQIKAVIDRSVPGSPRQRLVVEKREGDRDE